MKKVLLLMFAIMLIVGLMAGPALAGSDTGFEASPAFSGSTGHWTHFNDAPRFDTDTGRIAIAPAQAGLHSNSDKVFEWRGGSLIDPKDSW